MSKACPRESINRDSQGSILWTAFNPKQVTARRKSNVKGSLDDEMMFLTLLVSERSRWSKTVCRIHP